MLFQPGMRKLILTSHITFSVGWLGAVVVFLVLAFKGLTTTETQIAHAAFIAMEISTFFVIVPFCIASLLTGVVQSLGTKWGIFKHYWIVVKLVITVAMTALLILHLEPISQLANINGGESQPSATETKMVINLIKKSALALIALIGVTTISIYKPWGKIQIQGAAAKERLIKVHFKAYLFVGMLILAIAFIIIHILKGGMRMH
jgi:hypothetical protein